MCIIDKGINIINTALKEREQEFINIILLVSDEV